MDTFSVEQRSDIMKAVRREGTAPEMVVRHLLHALGYRYRLHAKELPGKPDIVFRPRHSAIFFHGCFWHGHNCRKGKLPNSRAEYWEAKIERNMARDVNHIKKLNADGWQVLVIWECETLRQDQRALVAKLNAFLR